MQRRIAGSIAGIRMVHSRASLLLIVMDTGRALPMMPWASPDEARGCDLPLPVEWECSLARVADRQPLCG